MYLDAAVFDLRLTYREKESLPQGILILHLKSFVLQEVNLLPAEKHQIVGFFDSQLVSLALLLVAWFLLKQFDLQGIFQYQKQYWHQNSIVLLTSNCSQKMQHPLFECFHCSVFFCHSLQLLDVVISY